MKVFIDPTNYKLCEESAKNMWSSSKQGVYGRGLINSKQDPFKVERVGRLGEMALSIYLDVLPDLSYKKFGDISDFIVKNLKIDIKTASRNYGKLLIQAVNEYGKTIPLKSSIYVGAYLESENINLKTALVTLVGFIDVDTVISLDTVPAIKGNHRNYSINYNTLTSIENLKGIVDNTLNSLYT